MLQLSPKSRQMTFIHVYQCLFWRNSQHIEKSIGLPGWHNGKESAWQCRRHRDWSLGGEDPLEYEMDTHSSILAWKIAWAGQPDRPQSMVLQGVRHDWAHVPAKEVSKNSTMNIHTFFTWFTFIWSYWLCTW